MVKKQLIMEKSLELFAERGFIATSVQEITEHCGISKGAFYLSFKSKDELIISLIEYFFKETIAGIDQLVRESNRDELLYNYYYYIFENLSKKSAFAKIFMKEQIHFLNNDFVTQIHKYRELMEQTELVIVEKVYRDKVNSFKYDLIYSIRGITSAYIELILFSHVQPDMDLLAKSLVEKTDILAKYMKTAYISKELYGHTKYVQKEVTTKEEIIEKIDEVIDILDTSIEKDTLKLLRTELIEPSLSEVITTGLLQNIKHHPACKWVYYLLTNYFYPINN